MGQLIGLAVLFYVVFIVCKKYLGNHRADIVEAIGETDRQAEIQAAYRDGFNDGIRFAEQKQDKTDHAK